MSSPSDLRQTLLQRAQELFALCDRQGKGYAYREELGALGGELPLSPEQLESVFDALDVDGDGRLTLQEFSDGFGMFLGIDSQPRNCFNASQLETEEEDEDDELDELLDHLGARNIFTDEDYVREMWHRVQKDDPVMRSNFENFISRMTIDLKQSLEERECLESTLKSKELENECRVQSLYAEMEEQLQKEKEEALKREQWKEQRLRDELGTELQLKDLQLQELIQKHAQMQKQLQDLNSGEAETKYENKKLQKDRDTLESRLAASERMLQDMQKQQDLLRKKSLGEKRMRAQAALKVSEDIALERENLVLELQNLKEMNKQLLDEKDELAQTTAYLIEKSPKIVNRKIDSIPEVPNITNSEKASLYNPLDVNSKQTNAVNLDRISDDCHRLENGDSSACVVPQGDGGFLDFKDGFDEDVIQNNLNVSTENAQKDEKRHLKPILKSNEARPKIQEKTTAKKVEEVAPSRVFKVVFVGDSGVGKTSILQRFCTDSFKATYNATIGVDFQIKTVSVDGERVALQLWDTAGQERFRSMTQQYFRKADGIVIVYDVTSESSFRSIRNWMHNIRDSVGENAALLVIGNKTDMCESDDDRVVRSKDGERIADEFGTLFYETSAKCGAFIRESLEGLASVLKSKEDEAMEKVLKLQEEMKERKKRKCC